jgi:hypothetical protein
MEKQELLAVKVRKIERVAEELRRDVDSIRQGMKALLKHHKAEWDESEASDYYAETGMIAHYGLAGLATFAFAPMNTCCRRRRRLFANSQEWLCSASTDF